MQKGKLCGEAPAGHFFANSRFSFARIYNTIILANIGLPMIYFRCGVISLANGFAGLRIGTSGLKASLVDEGLNILRNVTTTYPSTICQTAVWSRMRPTGG